MTLSWSSGTPLEAKEQASQGTGLLPGFFLGRAYLNIWLVQDDRCWFAVKYIRILSTLNTRVWRHGINVQGRPGQRGARRVWGKGLLNLVQLLYFGDVPIV